ncbi:hypothetical protein KFK09_021483 [Dendrobium nobile]|uniref:Uncharacterized protein n=1 Tax=Dendrobium nobile TaxID=94219 RepID=A0A8T3AR98_DENNO|nr:hypothetical protein KFK09_021483 [Dendrobium nobile]
MAIAKPPAENIKIPFSPTARLPHGPSIARMDGSDLAHRCQIIQNPTPKTGIQKNLAIRGVPKINSTVALKPNKTKWQEFQLDYPKNIRSNIKNRQPVIKNCSRIEIPPLPWKPIRPPKDAKIAHLQVYHGQSNSNPKDRIGSNTTNIIFQ